MCVYISLSLHIYIYIYIICGRRVGRAGAQVLEHLATLPATEEKTIEHDILLYYTILEYNIM